MLRSCMNYGWGRPGGWAPLLDILTVPVGPLQPYVVAKSWPALRYPNVVVDSAKISFLVGEFKPLV